MSQLVEDNFFVTYDQNIQHQSNNQYGQTELLDGLIVRIEKANAEGYNFKIKVCDRYIGKLDVVAYFKFQSSLFDFIVQIKIDLKNKNLKCLAALMKEQQYLLTQSNSKRRLICRKLLKVNNQIQFQGLKFLQNMDTGKIVLLTTNQQPQSVFSSKDLIWNKIRSNIKKLFQVYNTYSYEILQIIDKGKFKNYVCKTGGQQFKKLKKQQASYSKLVKQIQVSHINFGFSSKADQSSYPTFQKSKKQEAKLRDFIMKIIGQKFQNSKKLYIHDYQNILQINHKDISYEMQHAQSTLYSTYLKAPVPRNPSPGENKFILNQIQILKPQMVKFRQTSCQGGTCKIQVAHLSFYYCQSEAILKLKPKQNEQNFELDSIYKDSYTNCQQVKQKIHNPILNKYIAIKIPKKTRNQEIDLKAQNQKNIIKLFKSGVSAYILKYYISKQFYFPYKNYLLMDFLPNCQPLSNFVEIFNQTLSLYSKTYLIVNIANSLRFIQDYQIVHMDLNLNNILVYRDYLTKLIDFGQAFSPNLKSSYQINFKRGYTFPFCSPQYFERTKNYTTHQDIFSLGMIIYKLIFNDYPFFPSKECQQSYKDKSYLKRIFLAPQRGEAFAHSQTVDILYNIFFKCINPQQQIRCQPSWLTIFFKLIYFHLL